MELAVAAQQDASRRIDMALQALRLLKTGPISVIGRLTLGESSAVGVTGVQFTTTRYPRPPRDSYDLRDEEVEDLAALFAQLGDPTATASPALETALRRFGSSSERHDPEDRLVDLIISAEALFVESDVVGDLSLRVALRFARYVDPLSELPVIDLFNHMRDAYNREE